MDEQRFDDIARVLADPTTRRRVLSAISGGLLAAIGVAADLNAKNKGNGKKKPNGKKAKRKKQQQRCGRNVGGCDECHHCVRGRCVLDPAQEGSLCILTCLRCQGGACVVPDDEVCPDALLCNPQNGRCCPECLDGGCCPAGQSCIDPPAGDRYCCDISTHTACSTNGDGRYADCCDDATEKCCPALNTCIPKDQCCPDDPDCCEADQESCPERCCDSRTEKCHQGFCRDRCSLNTGYTKTCDDGVHYWCCWHDHQCGEAGGCIDT